MTENAYLAAISALITEFRGEDPTAPVTVLVSTVAEAEALRLTFARSADPVLRIGIHVRPVSVMACLTPMTARAEDVQDCVRDVLGSTYFATLQGLPGVVSTLASCIDVWDQALPYQREALLPDRSSGDADRLWGMADLYDKVRRAVVARGQVMPSTAAEHVDIDASALWIDSTLALPAPVVGAWLRTLYDTAKVECVLPGEGWTPGTEVLLSAVDPVDEASRAARRVTQLLEEGVAARNIAVVAPAAELDRYRALIGVALQDAGVPFDGNGFRRHAGTHVGRLVTAAVSGINAISQPRDLTFDQIRDLILCGGVSDAQGERVDHDRLVGVWTDLRGTDPAGWARFEGGGQDEAALAIAREAAALLTLVVDSDHVGPAWSELADAFGPMDSSCTVVSGEDAATQVAFNDLLTRWSRRPGRAFWAEARDELHGLLMSGHTDPSGGVMFLPFEAGWAACAQAVIGVGLSDDLLPGVRSALGPLAAHEVVRLLAADADRGVLARDGQRQVAALGACSASLSLSYSRSDLLRTIVRQPSRFLASMPRRHVECVTAQPGEVADGALGLLGPADAAAAQLRAGQPARTERDLSIAARCATSRLQPPAPDDVDAFNGDLTALSQEVKARLSPDVMRGDPDSPRTSPSTLEHLLACPIGWWASSVLGVEEPKLWDPLEMDPAVRGSWLHEALQLLESRHRLATGAPSRPSIEQALWDALGGRPEAGLPPQEFDVDLHSYRYRVDGHEVDRQVNILAAMIDRLAAVLRPRGVGDGPAETETALGPEPLPLDSGALSVAGRVDRIDVTPGGGIVVTDYKTGATGSGFQLAVYAWLRLLGSAAGAELMYAHADNQAYGPHPLLGDEADPLRYSRADLEEYLVGALSEPVRRVRTGRISSSAWSDAHDRYCVLCSDLRQPTGQWGAFNRGVRAVALSSSRAPEEGDL